MIFLGTLAANASAAVNNHSTAVPFDIPNETKRLYFEASTDNVFFEIGAGTGTNFDTFTTTAARGKKLYGSNDPYFVEEVYPVPQIGQSPINAASAWVAGATYSVGDQVSNLGNLYVCVTAGVSNLYGTGPSTIGYFSGDGTCAWRWLGASEAAAVPSKSIVRVAIFNGDSTATAVRVWAV